jgi:predicted GNAT family acetyltransferase
MRLRRFKHVKEFWQQTENYLIQSEAEHNALIGIVQTLIHYPERYPEPPYLAVVEANGAIAAIAIRTPPNNLLLSKVQELDALQLIVQDLQQEALPGVCGLVTEVEMFVQMWHSLTGQPYQRELNSRIYRLTQVKPVPAVQGYLKPAAERDRPLLLEWFSTFYADINISGQQEIEQMVEVALKRQSIYLWEDGIPVSMVGGRPFIPTAARIAPVYTPPEHRCRGYATASVAALSQKLLDEGCKSCYLYTDLANPTSNSIYQQIGYQSVCDWYDYGFMPPASG